ncbi:carbon-nitrogen hydrolase family protein [Erythrobacter sp. THAF29]|uniref:carbon-nitrogen hydrolase family protein n=1 Tax=Erythrobacter sp. THAF29 TaxID=2587851 RepID=UPI00126892D6|nr:carbon-nitrogen hydrolase family protein [Erythrobacter sp. THAF29]QFT77956.1 2-oxoglutaramate amidase [Erythrobacter sp. THAF29]
MPKIAVLQMNSGLSPEANFGAIEEAVQEAKAGGAEMIFTPEMALLLDRDRKRAANSIDSSSYRKYTDRFRSLAANTRIDIALGSMPVRLESGMLANRSFYFRAHGGRVERYDKIHMFDVDLSSGESWRESNAYEPGAQVVTVDDSPLGRLGLTVCYDLRFPALFDELGRRRCDAIAVPAAFTRPTGEAHWHVLLRSRAIEASAFVIAAAQVGRHEDGRETFGHSLVVDPWGDVLLDMGGDKPGLAFCDIDLGRIAEVREQVPSLANKREIPK